MREHEFLDAVSHIEADVVESFVAMDARLQKRAGQSRARKVWLRVGAAAASLAVLTGTVSAGMRLWNIATMPEAPVWADAAYTAEEIAGLFNAMTYLDGATNAYTKVYVSDAEYLYVEDLPEVDSMELYLHDRTDIPMNEDELTDFIDGILPTLAESLQTPAPKYGMEESDSGVLSTAVEFGAYSMHAFQNRNGNTFRLYGNVSGGDRRIVLDGKTVQMDQRLSDGEVLENFTSLRDKLFDIFGVSFSDAVIVRKYDGYSEYGAGRVDIYFFDEDAHPLNTMQSDKFKPVSDYLCVSFENYQNYAGDTVSDGVLTVAEITYHQTRKNVSEEYAATGSAELISLEEAEALLYNGYVFGGHSCPLCMAEQSKVSFRGYDFVDIEYVFEMDTKTSRPLRGMPFYAFYKKIGRSKNGNAVYAKTYVAAIRVKGYAAYFASQEKEHRKTGFYEFG